MAAQGWFDPELVVADWFPVDIKAWFDSTLVSNATAAHATTGNLTGPGSTVAGHRRHNWIRFGRCRHCGASVAAYHNGRTAGANGNRSRVSQQV
jgi:hypothetical protein